MIFLGGGIGAILRHYSFLFLSTQSTFLGNLNYGTIFVNIIGSFAMGSLWILSDNFGFSKEVKSLILVGLLGAFTTFSTYSLDVIKHFLAQEYQLAILHITINNVLSISFAFLGVVLSNYIIKLIK